MIYLVLGFLIGYGVALIHKGIHIHVDKAEKQETKQEYNESMAKYLPPEVQNYYTTTQGQNKF